VTDVEKQPSVQRAQQQQQRVRGLMDGEDERLEEEEKPGDSIRKPTAAIDNGKTENPAQRRCISAEFCRGACNYFHRSISSSIRSVLH
jgi:hypothetical protein